MNSTYDVSFEKTKDNLTTVKVNGYYLHSKFNPLLEAEKLVKDIYKPHHLHIIFGYGMGYIIEALSKKRKFNEPIIIIDPLLDKGLLAKENIDNQYNTHYVSVEKTEDIRGKISNLAGMTNKIHFFISPNYKKIFLTESHKIAQLVNDVQKREMINVSTTMRFALDWQINYAMNLRNINNDMSLNKLFKIYDCPIVVAASGPSLSKQLSLLKEYRKRIILICAGSTINSLLNAGIQPDYVVSIDGGINNFQHFENIKLDYSELIYSPLLHYKVRNQFTSTCYAFVPYVRPALNNILKKKMKKELPIIIGGGSVAHYALSIAKYMTSGPICMIGQDLAYTNDQTHSSGNKNNKTIENNNLVLVDGYFDEKVKTDITFKSMIQTFEEMNNFHPHETFIFNCTEGGAKISGYLQKSFQDFLNQYTFGEVTKVSIVCLNSEVQTDLLKEDFEGYDKILNLLKKGLKIIDKEPGPVFSIDGINQIKKIEKKLNMLYLETCVDMLLEPITTFAEHEFLPPVDENIRDEFKRIKEYITVLYTESIKMIEKYIEQLNKILKEESEEQ